MMVLPVFVAKVAPFVPTLVLDGALGTTVTLMVLVAVSPLRLVAVAASVTGPAGSLLASKKTWKPSAGVLSVPRSTEPARKATFVMVPGTLGCTEKSEVPLSGSPGAGLAMLNWGTPGDVPTKGRKISPAWAWTTLGPGSSAASIPRIPSHENQRCTIGFISLTPYCTETLYVISTLLPLVDSDGSGKLGLRRH